MAEMCLSLPTINEESRGNAFPHLNEMLVYGNFTSPPTHGSIFSSSPDNLLLKKKKTRIYSQAWLNAYLP